MIKKYLIFLIAIILFLINPVIMAEWTRTEVVTKECWEDSDNPSLAIGPDRTIHIVWEDLTPLIQTNYWNAYYKYYSFSTKSWSYPRPILYYYDDSGDWPIGIGNGDPKIGVSPEGILHFAWDSVDYNEINYYNEILYRLFLPPLPPEDRWSNILSISEGVNPSIDVDLNGKMHLAWRQGHSIGYINYVFAQGLPDPIYFEPGGCPTELSIDVDTQGNVHFIWTTPVLGNIKIYYRRYNPDTEIWSDIIEVPTNSESATNPVMAVDSEGIVYIAWEDFAFEPPKSDLYLINYSTETDQWASERILVSEDSDGYSMWPSIGIDSTNKVHIAWSDYFEYAESGSDFDIFYRNYTFTQSGFQMSDIELISSISTGFSRYSTLAVGPDDVVHIAWVDNTDYDDAGTDDDIFYRRTTTRIAPRAAFEIEVYKEFLSDNIKIDIDPRRSSDYDGNIVLYEWDWQSDGIWDYSTTSPRVLTFTQNRYREFMVDDLLIVTLQVTDNDGLTDIASMKKIAHVDTPIAVIFGWLITYGLIIIVIGFLVIIKRKK